MSNATRVRDNEPDEDVEVEEGEEEVKGKAGRPKGSKGGRKLAKPILAVTLTKRGIPKKVLVTHVTNKGVSVVSAANPEMDPIRLNLNNVRVYDGDTYEAMESRGEKIDTLIEQQYGLLNQLEQLNAPKRGAVKVFDPAEEL